MTTTRIALTVATMMLGACATAPPKPKGPTMKDQRDMLRLEVEAKTRDLMDATDQLRGMQTNVDDMKRRLSNICADYADHQVCDLHAAAKYAAQEFCADPEFTQHLDGIVSACHQGSCKQVDEANLLNRTDYMQLVQRLPHSLVLFKVNKTRLDRRDKKQLQAFIEHVNASKGYLIVVGRASRDGGWKHNLRLALDRAESTRKYLVEDLGVDEGRAGYITYGHAKMYITETDARRLSEKKLSTKQANRSALVFAYPCYDGQSYDF